MNLKVSPTHGVDARCQKATEANKSSLLCTEIIIPGESSAQSGKEPAGKIPAEDLLGFMMEKMFPSSLLCSFLSF